MLIATNTPPTLFCYLNELIKSLLYKLKHIFLATAHPLITSSGRNFLGSTFMAQANIGKKRIEIGPWGGQGGSGWDDGSYDGIREISLVYGRCIDSIRIVYDKNGKPFTAEKHGGQGGDKTGEVKLQFPEEYLTGVSGHYGQQRGNLVIRSLTFTSNRRTFGPFGWEEGTSFSLPMEGGRIVGFKGRSGWYVDSIGCYIARIQPPTAYQKVQKTLKRLTGTASPEQNRYRGSKAASY